MARKSKNQPILLVKQAPQNIITIPEEEYVNSKETQLPVGGYIRLSSENKAEDSIQSQIDIVKAYIDGRNDLDLVDFYVDNGFTGTNFDRPNFIRMMEDVKKGIIRGIVVKDLSRFGRDYLETGYYIETLFPHLNVRLIAITDNFDSSREGDRNSIALPIKNMVNAMYAKDASKKQSAFHEMCRKTGKYVKQAAPYGYVYSKEENRLIIDAEVEPFVRLVFAWTLAGVPRSVIAQRMEILAAPTALADDGDKKVKWTAATVKAILRNPTYAGYLVMGKSRRSLYYGIEPVAAKRGEWFYFPNYHEAYITEGDYKKIEEIMADNISRIQKRQERNADIREKMTDCFSGIVFCANCGRRMSFCRASHHRDYSDRSFMTYRCHNFEKNPLCSNMVVQQNYLKIVVMDQLSVLMKIVCDKKRLLEDVKKKYEKPGSILPLERNIHRLEEKEKEIEGMLLKAYMDFADGLLNEEEYLSVKSKYTVEKDSIAVKKKEFSQKLVLTKQSVEQYLVLVERFEALGNTSDFDAPLVRELVNRIVVCKDRRIELVLNFQDVFQDELISEYLEDTHDTDTSLLFETV